MSDATILQAKKRDATGRLNSKKTREEKKIPAVIYGSEIETQPLEMDFPLFMKVYSSVGESSLIDLVVDEQEPVKVIIQEVQRDALTDDITHIDFYQVKMGEKLKTEVEIEFTGLAPAEKELGGIVVKNASSLEIECLPKDLPQNIVVSLDGLKTFDDMIRIKDLQLPEGVEALHDAEETVVSVSEPRSEEELQALEEDVVEDVDSVEVEEGAEEDEAEGEGAEEGEAAQEKEQEEPAEEKKE